jgi:8-oxo-dGTP pyrophosphatase MutT (NUDIX family)
MIEGRIVASIRRRLAVALAPPVLPMLPLVVADRPAGWLDAPRLRRLRGFSRVFVPEGRGIRFHPSLADAGGRTHALAEVTATLAAEGALSAWRNERYAVAPAFGAPPWFLVERAAARYFGVHTHAAHVNGLSVHEGTAIMWLARRSPTKAIDPGMLDNLVGGGIAAGMSIAATVEKEAWEEAGIDAPLARQARATGTVQIRRAQPDGLQRETIFVHDLALPEDWTPRNQDGEAVEHRRAGCAEVARLIALEAGRDQVTADASLVIVDYLLRAGLIAADAPEAAALAALRLNGPD